MMNLFERKNQRPSLSIGVKISILFLLVDQFVQSTADPISSVHEKLETYALGSAKASTLTPDDLIATREAYKKWDSTQRNNFESKDPTHALLTDFLLHPMERSIENMRAKNDVPEVIDEVYVKRLEKNYKKFRVAYMGGMIGEKYHRCRKTDLLIMSLMDLKGKQELTTRMVYDAMVEYNAMMHRLSDIMIYEDVYGTLEELKQLLNFTNRTAVKILKQVVYPRLEKLKTKGALDNVKDLYKDEMANQRLIEVNGKLKWVSRADAIRWRQAKKGN